MDEIAENEPLMAAIGRIALRSAELGEILDAIISRLNTSSDPASFMLGRKIDTAKKEIRKNIPEISSQFDEFCCYIGGLTKNRNRIIHATFDTDWNNHIVKWDHREGLSNINVSDLNNIARKFKDSTDKSVEYLLKVQDFLGAGA